MIHVAVAGATGRMGRAVIERVVRSDNMRLTGALVSATNPLLGTDPGAPFGHATGIKLSAVPEVALAGSHVVIDFSAVSALARTAAVAAQEYIACVIGVTAITDEAMTALRDAAERVPVFIAANMSVGVAVMAHLARTATRLLGATFDVEVIEAHHRHKRDAPSGTAMKLVEAIREGATAPRALDTLTHGREGRATERSDREIGMHAVRAGGIVGDHTVMFASDAERIEIVHRAHDRGVFADGSLRAARWAASQSPGLYGMNDLLDLT